MKNIRQSVFETNSSSSHSITISDITDLINLDTILPDENGVITLNGGEFGWERIEFHDALTKANYCAVDSYKNPEKLQMLIDVIMEHTQCKAIAIDIDTDWNSGNWSYIDHQSQGTSHEAFASKELLKAFIFNQNSYLETGNNNDYDEDYYNEYDDHNYEDDQEGDDL